MTHIGKKEILSTKVEFLLKINIPLFMYTGMKKRLTTYKPVIRGSNFDLEVISDVPSIYWTTSIFEIQQNSS